MSVAYGMKIVPPKWFAAIWTPNGRPVRLVLTAPTLNEVLDAMEKMKDAEDFKEIKVYRHGFKGLRRWVLPGDSSPIRDIATFKHAPSAD